MYNRYFNTVGYSFEKLYSNSDDLSGMETTVRGAPEELQGREGIIRFTF